MTVFGTCSRVLNKSGGTVDSANLLLVRPIAMASESEPTLRRVPSLVSYCQRGEHP